MRAFFTDLVGSPANTGTALGRLGATPDMRDGWEQFVERYTWAADRSTWHAGKLSRLTHRSGFTNALLIRTHFYLLASQVFDAPYRPDALRAPICWTFFGAGSYADFGLERFVQEAERMSSTRFADVNAFFGRGFRALPLFIGDVLRRSRDPTQVIPIALDIRASRDARRFRAHLKELSGADDAGDIRRLSEELGRYSALLRAAFGGSRPSADVVWSVAASAAKAAIAPDPAAVVDLAGDVGKSSAFAVDHAGGWLYRRKVALIAKTVKQALKAHSLQAEARRVFAAELDKREARFLERVTEIARGPVSS